MDTTETIAGTFLRARVNGWALAEFPLAPPGTLAEAYAIQEIEIARLGSGFTGWKIAMVKPDLRARFGAERISGPIVRLVDARPVPCRRVDVCVIRGGYAAVEAEFAFLMGHDLPLRNSPYSEAKLVAAIAALHIGAEVAGSPLASISDLGPAAVVADHGNNAAIVIGDEIADWRQRPLDSMVSRTMVDGVVAGEGSAARLEGGPLGALAYLVDNLAGRGRTLKAGEWVSTGATTGVHRIAPGGLAVLDFGSMGTITIGILAQPEI
jgi:2-keto-4-pentenoate hydratase